jgi:hypothetical protein
MKLSNKDLHYALWCAEKHTGNSLYDEAMADLDEGVLEIEGFERVQWTKFDPKDESTFPDNLTTVLVCYRNGKVHEEFHWTKGEFGVNTGPTTITHWRSLPPPPVESEANDETK